MEIQFQHHHDLTFCDQNKQNFSQILLKFFKPNEINRKILVYVGSIPRMSLLHMLKNFHIYAHPDYPNCFVCFRIIYNGPVYFCEKCDDIWVHKSCASLPPEIRAHPLHLQHDHLSLTPNISMSCLCCHFCWDEIRMNNYYECSECGFKLDCECALSPDNDDLQQITASLSPDTKTQISHDIHPHTLFFFNSSPRKKGAFSSNSCKLCHREVLDLTYGCFRCNFYLHKKCVEIIQHPFHSHRPVSIQYHHGKFICDQCRDLCSDTFMAICKTCDFKNCFNCAFFRDATIQRSIRDEVKTQFKYFNHHLHPLSFFNFNCTNEVYLECGGCRFALLGPCYGCLKCSVYLHKSCAEAPQIIRHPYHPFCYLFLEDSRAVCRACGNDANSLNYRCHLCPSFQLDIQCAINNLGVISALKNKEYHQHDLYYFMPPERTKFTCIICSKNCEGSFYNCLECKAYFHMECIGLPKEVKHDSHIHPLILMDPLTEDHIDESKDQYYCYTCENKRNPRYHAYSCQQCIFTAHIECVLSTELNEIEHNHMIEEDDEEKFPDLAKLSISPRCMKQLLVKDKYNDHILDFFEDKTDLCYLCDDKFMESPCYKCSFCQIYLHEECAKLPFKIKHNLHEHPLSIRGGDFLKTFICDGCQVYHESDMCYHCEKCSFSLDRMCAQGIPSTSNHYQKLNDSGSKVGFSYFFHEHKLRFAFILEKHEVDCSACRLLISGPTYCCYACYFFLHESCFNELKSQNIQHPFHIQHPLHFKDTLAQTCKACKYQSDIGYECAECDFRLDIKCVKYLTSGLQHKCHRHKLFCFVAEDLNSGRYYWCEHCDQECNAFFYRCLDCDVNLHIECMLIPKNVKSACHVHPLTLMDSINEEGQVEYYCDTCENLRNPKHAAYYCETCNYTAHIGCVLDEEEGEIEIL